ncbi:MAG: SdrD B-like domain-containing protein, partial [Snowella sp.]|nr:SdrD B-like domain-containing protein [Snowella sp.]
MILCRGVEHRQWGCAEYVSNKTAFPNKSCPHSLTAKEIKSMSLSEVTLNTLYTLTGEGELVPGTTFAEVYNVYDPSGVLTEAAYNAWCLDARTTLAPNFTLNFLTYSGNELADGLSPNAIATYSGRPWDGNESNLDLVNWLLNQNYVGSDASVALNSSLTGAITVGDVQKAIWKILGQEPFLTRPDFDSIGSFDQRRVDAIAAAALANGQGFVADATQVQGIVLIDNITGLERFGLQPGKITQPLFLVTQAAQLGDYVWLDVDKDGIQDETELGLGGVTVKLLRDINGNGEIAFD